jgi:hypothetical protein
MMKTRKYFVYVVVGLIGLFGGRCSCNNKSPTASVDSPTGTLAAKLKVGEIGSLGKRTAINLAEGYMQLTATGQTPRLDSFPLTGGSLALVDRYVANLAVGSWQMKAWSKDVNGVVIHSDSSSFVISNNDTTYDTLDLAANFSNLVLNFPKSDSTTIYQVWENGRVIVNDTIAKGSLTGPLSRTFDYLPASVAGTSDTITVKIFGDFVQTNVLLWDGQAVFNVVSGVNVTQVMHLTWRGPAIGDVDMVIKFQAAGKVTITVAPDPRPNSTTTP